MMDDINKKINELFREEEGKKVTTFNNSSTLEEFTEEEKKEVEDYLRVIRERTPRPPKQIWHWNFYGIILLLGIVYSLEFMAIWLLIATALPYAINIEWMTPLKAFTITGLITLYRLWKQISFFKFFIK